MLAGIFKFDTQEKMGVGRKPTDGYYADHGLAADARIEVDVRMHGGRLEPPFHLSIYGCWNRAL